ncbi:3-phosphoshikimate 1-carboxyvinyltransferase [Acanthopleuribacter pedis]|uniref:3-phosphoshikimate 1-carboxyvinyltransferase n=1 Tax=Acanthopleuribacter pedis TaxID=442870 RepID=A0A8J7Q9T5_9BACT|nr:3-phosphoshikimate 1-carboxyvinyltransferase [Acanthopleuribacter pedis]MBO1320382.1 3-phosphoshikimate 1-carboxyvinyltransferase [Acanthopleuribacter pedis]
MVSPFDLSQPHAVVSPAAPVATRAAVPGSKSLTNRYLLLAAAAAGTSFLKNPLHSDDTTYMRAALKAMGVTIDEQPEGWSVHGRSPWQNPTEPLFIGNAGTAMRFLTPALPAQGVAATITGNERMLVRPIKDLVDGLRQLKTEVAYRGEEGFPPLQLQPPLTGGACRIRGDASSQYLSGLLMALPTAQQDSLIEIEGPLVSRTYVAMTLDCMARLGVTVGVNEDHTRFEIAGGQTYRATDIDIEPDASTASYWFALPLMVGGTLTVPACPEQSHQGDFGLVGLLAEMGARVTRDGGELTISDAPLNGVDVDMNTMSDVAPTLAVVATRAQSPTTIRNIYNMRIKECDRIEALQTAFDQLGLKMENGRDWIKIYPGRVTTPALVNPEDDHRMAMVFALLGLADGGVGIRDPECVAKTYPTFYEAFGAVLHRK